MKKPAIEKNIEIAIKIYSDRGKNIKNSLSLLLEKARRAVEKSRSVSYHLGIGEICHRCDKEEGGSCCGAGIENRYREELLVANMLCGVFPPSSYFDENSCYFLGPEGCILIFRHTLCVNFLCKKLYDLLGIKQIILIQNAIGEEIELTFRLCDQISRIIRAGSKP